MLDWLNGKKTYIVAAVSILAAWVGVWDGSVDFASAWQITQTGALGATLRKAIS